MYVWLNMNPHERILRTFQKRKVDKVVWQPRIYYWYYGNRLKNRVPNGYEDESLLDSFYDSIEPYDGSVPERYKDKTMIGIYDDLNASPRYPQEVLGINLFKYRNEKVKVKSTYDEDRRLTTTVYDTPMGNLEEVKSHGYKKEYPVKDLDDIKIMEYILDDTEFEFDMDAFKIADQEFGKRGVVQTFYARSPFQRLIVDYMGFENTILTLHRYPSKVEEFMRAIEEWDDKMYEVLLNSPIEILNLGENIDVHFDSPPLFEKYLLPYYEKRIDQIHQRGKFSSIHVDGSFKPLIPLLNESSFDALEALTPLPQGDVTLEEMKEAVGDKILMDGIPAVLFTPQYSHKDLEKFTIKVLEVFSPNLILGISDELPPTADIEKVRFVSELVEDFDVPQAWKEVDRSP